MEPEVPGSNQISIFGKRGAFLGLAAIHSAVGVVIGTPNRLRNKAPYKSFLFSRGDDPLETTG
jgi:hypothetical protein